MVKNLQTFKLTPLATEPAASCLPQPEGSSSMTNTPQVLIPFHRSEAVSIAAAAADAGRSVRTMREWCNLHDIGRRIGGQWAVSKVALAMYLNGDRVALRAYLAGDRSSSTVTAYFERCGVPIPRQHLDGSEGKTRVEREAV
jgi:hypothetical protein